MKKLILCITIIFISLQSFSQEFDLFWKNGHKGRLKTTSISPGSNYFISVDEDNVAIIWDIASGQQIKVLKRVCAAAFTANEKILLVMDDMSCKTVDLMGNTIQQHSNHQYQVKKNTWDLARKLMPEAGIYIDGDNIFDINRGYLTNTYGRNVGYSVEGKVVATADDQTGKIELTDLFTGKVTGNIQTANIKKDKMQISFSANGTTLLMNTKSLLQVIDISPLGSPKTIPNVKGEIEDIALSPDGKTAAIWTSGDNKYFKLINIKTNSIIWAHEYSLNSSYSISITFNPNANTVLLEQWNSRTGSVILTLKELNTGTNVWTRELKDILNVFTEQAFSKDQTKLLLWGNLGYEKKEHIIQLNLLTGELLWKIDHDYMSTSVDHSYMSYSPDDQKILFGTYKKIMWVNAVTGTIEKTFASTTPGYIEGLNFTQDKKHLIGRVDEHVFVWNLQTGAMENTLLAKGEIAQTWENDSKLASAGNKFFVFRDNKLTELNNSGKLVFQYTGLQNLQNPYNIAVSYDDQYVMNQGCPQKGGICSGDDALSTIEIFDTHTHKLVYTKSGVKGYAAFAKTQNVLVVKEASNSQLLRFYEIPSGKLLFDIKVPRANMRYNKPLFSENDLYLTLDAIEDKDEPNAIKILINLKTKIVKSFPVTIAAAIDKSRSTHQTYAFIYHIGFTPDEKYIVYIGNPTRNILFYDIEKGQFDEQMTLNNPKGIERFSSISISPNGKFLFLGTYTGSILLWNIQQKMIQAIMYPEMEKGNWAIIKSDGLFDANDGAQSSLYHVTGNTVVPLSAVFEKFYAPRLLPRILGGENFSPSVVDVNKLKKAPTVKISLDNQQRNLVVSDDIQSYNSEKEQEIVKIQADCPSDAVTEIRLYQNGKLVQTTRNLVVEDDNIAGVTSLTKTFTVMLSEGQNNFKALAFNTERTESHPAEITVTYKVQKTSITQNTAVGIQLYVVVIGINKYKNPKYNLNYAMDDASSFKEAIEKGGTSIFSKTNVVFIADDKATKEGITSELDKIKMMASANDVFIFYYAGHGVMNDKKEFYLVPTDVIQLYGADGALSEKGLSSNQLQQYSKDIKAQKQLFILDACQSAGALEQVVAARGAEEEKAIAQLARSTGTYWLTASGSTQFASEFTQLGHGAFTYVLIEALSGKADTGDKKITVKEIDAYLQDFVPKITEKYKGSPQYPSSYGYGNDFPIIILK